jgi:hypothetical protein
MDVGQHYLENALSEFRRLKKSADKAMAQVSDAEFFQKLDAEANSIALIAKHITGNLHSRWKNFLTTDGEKPDRNRDREFEHEPADTRASLMERWERGWAILFEELEPLKGEDLLRTVLIRSEPYTVLRAINRQLTHYGEHVGQIVLLAKHLAGARWQTLSTPRGKSEEFNAKWAAKFKQKN